METTRIGEVPPFLGADLTDRYARNVRPIDVCGLAPEGVGFTVRFWTWTWDPAPNAVDADWVVKEFESRASMLDGPQALARVPEKMRACERLTGAPGKTPHQRPALHLPFAGFVNSALDLFAALQSSGVPISPAAGLHGCGEVYPGDMWSALRRGLPKKTTRAGRRLRACILTTLGVRGLPELPTHDQNDAAIGAMAAAALAGAVPGVGAQLIGDAVVVGPAGELREGPMVRLSVTSVDLRGRLAELVVA